jgi:hypothetical protein
MSRGDERAEEQETAERCAPHRPALPGRDAVI